MEMRNTSYVGPLGKSDHVMLELEEVVVGGVTKKSERSIEDDRRY